MSTCIVWFRKSLRLHDNPALTAACLDKEVTSIIPLYVLDPAVLGKNYENFGPGRLRFLIESLCDLDSLLSAEYASKLIVLQGDPLTALQSIGQKLDHNFSSLFCEYGSEPYEREKFSSINQALGGPRWSNRPKTARSPPLVPIRKAGDPSRSGRSARVTSPTQASTHLPPRMLTR